jgi:hypothetical protein
MAEDTWVVFLIRSRERKSIDIENVSEEEVASRQMRIVIATAPSRRGTKATISMRQKIAMS